MRESVKLFQRMVRTELQGRGSFVLFGQKNPPPLGGVLFFFSIAFVTCFWYHGNRNGHSTSLGEKAKGDDAVIKKTLYFTMVKI